MQEENQNLLKSNQNIKNVPPFYEKYCQFVYRHLKPVKAIFENKNNQQAYQLDLEVKKHELTYHGQNFTKKKLFLDLDETLIHSESEQNYNGDKSLVTTLRVGSQSMIIFVRPYCFEFLKKLSEFYDVIIFTASQQSYAKKIVTFLNKHTNNSIKHVVSRSHCVKILNYPIYFKDLRVFKNVSPSQAIIVDNSMGGFYPTIDNGVPIKSYIQDPKDQQLKFLTNLLSLAAQEHDVRTFLSQKFKIKQIIQMYEFKSNQKHKQMETE